MSSDEPFPAGDRVAAALGNPAVLASAFPFHLVIDSSLLLRQIGSGLTRIDPEIRPGDAFDRHFTLARPARPASWAALAGPPNAVFEIVHRRTGLELRGQMLLPDAAGPAVFLGASWLTDPAELAEFGITETLPSPTRQVSPRAATPMERSLAVQLAAARCLAEAGSTGDALTRLVEALPESLGWPGAALWMTGAGGGLVDERHWPPDFSPPEAAPDLAAAALAAGAPLWHSTPAAFALPIHSGSGTVAVIACFGTVDEPEDAELSRALAVVAGQLAQFVARQAVGERLRRLTSELAAIFQLSPDGFVAFNEAGEHSYVNPALLRMTGLTRDAFDGLDEAGFEARLTALCDPDQPAVSDDDGTTIRLLRPRPRSLRRARREARDADGRLFGRVLYFRDITREAEIDRMKTEFLATAAHELRTPLASIHGFTELLLRREFAADKRRDIVETIFAQTSRLVGMVNELLDLARIEAGAGEDFEIVRQPLLPVLDAVLAQFPLPGDSRRVDFRVPPDLAGTEVAIDRDKFIRALTNVVSNAYKYSPQGGTIELRLRHDARRIGIAVRDHGMGMNAEQLARIFDRFFRANPGGAIPGTGLGMSLVRQVIEFHDGSVELDSAPGRGTEVTLWLPRGDGAAGDAVYIATSLNGAGRVGR